jgi:hypothetical protein
MLNTFLPPPTNQCAIYARYTNTNHLQASTYSPSTYRTLTHLFLPTAHEAILIFHKTFNYCRHNLLQLRGGKKLMWRVNLSLAMMSTFQQIALVPPCRNPTLAKCGGEAQHLEKSGIWGPPGLPNVQSSTAGPKTPRIGVFLVSLERSWIVDIKNGLAMAIWISVAQVMGKRRAGSQTGSLTLDH